ncbi:hypothetical protein ABZV80_39650 [Streptomyces sp. NPDC005132]|uniref:hypothetical protein n=1 Tax=Streptomyces sp. NPDC005132 TaxID=3154294 RepID=UPI0033B812E3
MPYYPLTVAASRRTNLGLQVEPAVRIREFCHVCRPQEAGGAIHHVPASERRKDGLVHTHGDPADPDFTLALGGRGGPDEALPVGTEIWLDDNAPTNGHRTDGLRRIIAGIASGDWHQAAPDAVDTTVTDR